MSPLGFSNVELSTSPTVGMSPLNHIFIACENAQDLWNRTDNLLLWQNSHESIKSLCNEICYISTRRTKKGAIAFNFIAVLLWTIWLERNQMLLPIILLIISFSIPSSLTWIYLSSRFQPSHSTHRDI